MIKPDLSIDGWRKDLGWEQVIVLGHGHGAVEWLGGRKPDVPTIGVNDHLSVFGWEPTCLVLLDGLQRFNTVRAKAIQDTASRYMASHLGESRLKHSCEERIRFIRGVRVSPTTRIFVDPRIVPISTTSVFAATVLAVWSGAKLVTVAGVDLRGHHLGRLGRSIEADFNVLKAQARAIGCEVDLRLCSFGREPLPTREDAPTGKEPVHAPVVAKAKPKRIRKKKEKKQ